MALRVLVLFCSLAYISAASGYAVLTRYDAADCSGEPSAIQAQVTEVAALSYFGDDHNGCQQLKEKHSRGNSPRGMRLHTEEGGDKCLADFYTDENCQGGMQTKQLWNGRCVNKQADGGHVFSYTLKCTDELPEKLDWNATCLTKEDVLQTPKMRREMRETKAWPCFTPCMKGAEQHVWTASREAFDAAFEKGGCAESCEAGMKFRVFTLGVTSKRFDCNFKAPLIPQRGGRLARAVTV
mmetsp:Transcript_9768/g.17637  ORF Transcript_9768/g.17637 Transcript_9768/m.17637 type:complete len:239 (+) Transcript_9768:89-805(+)